jgi:hypothetical protein
LFSPSSWKRISGLYEEWGSKTAETEKKQNGEKEQTQKEKAEIQNK